MQVRAQNTARKMLYFVSHFTRGKTRDEEVSTRPRSIVDNDRQVGEEGIAAESRSISSEAEAAQCNMSLPFVAPPAATLPTTKFSSSATALAGLASQAKLAAPPICCCCTQGRDIPARLCPSRPSYRPSPSVVGVAGKIPVSIADEIDELSRLWRLASRPVADTLVLPVATAVAAAAAAVDWRVVVRANLGGTGPGSPGRKLCLPLVIESGRNVTVEKALVVDCCCCCCCCWRSASEPSLLGEGALLSPPWRLAVDATELPELEDDAASVSVSGGRAVLFFVSYGCRGSEHE